MPELPEVESVRRTIAPQILEQSFVRVECAPYPRLLRPSPELLASNLTGKQIQGVERLGKLLIVTLSQGAFLTIHLGMTGQLIYSPREVEASHLHLAARLSRGFLYYRDPRRFGALRFYPNQAELNLVLKKMGPDALTISDRDFAKAIGGRSAPVKMLLLNQALLSGVGNIYADEGLHLARITPTRPGSELSGPELKRLNRALQKVMLKSLELGGSSVKNFVDANGRPGTFQEEHRVYQRAGQNCPTCKGIIQKMVLGGRSTHYCPRCQI